MPRRVDCEYASEDEFLRAAIRYEPEEGVFYRLLSAKPLLVGKQTGGVNSRGYSLVRYCWRKKFKSRLAHRLAFFLMEGSWPAGVIDHIDGDKLNNRWVNLRHVTIEQNLANTPRGRCRTVVTIGGLFFPVFTEGFSTRGEAEQFRAEALTILGLF